MAWVYQGPMGEWFYWYLWYRKTSDYRTMNYGIGTHGVCYDKWIITTHNKIITNYDDIDKQYNDFYGLKSYVLTTKHSFGCYYYAANILGGRFYEGEQYILEHVDNTIWYMNEVIQGHWQEALDRYHGDKIFMDWYSKYLDNK